MRGTTPVPLSPQLIRDGNPEALEELVRRRGTAVVAYAAVFGEEIVDDAVTETFARFRAAVHAQNELVTDQPDQLLLSCTRNSVSSMIAARRAYPCTSTVPLMVAGAEQELGPEALERLEAHVQGCDRCREDRSRFAQAERAYRNGRVAAVVPAIADRAVAAMLAAAPVAGSTLEDAELEPELVEPYDDPPVDVREQALLEALRDEDPDDDDDEVVPHGQDDAGHTYEVPAVVADGTRQTAVQRVLLPAGIVVVAVIGAAAVAGVFGGTTPAPAGGVTAPPGPRPPARRPPADEATQVRAADAARAALTRIEAAERRTTRAAALERAAEQAREDAREDEDDDTPDTGTATPGTTGTQQPRSGATPSRPSGREDGAGTRGESEAETLPGDTDTGSGSTGAAPEFEPSPPPSPTATP